MKLSTLNKMLKYCRKRWKQRKHKPIEKHGNETFKGNKNDHAT